MITKEITSQQQRDLHTHPSRIFDTLIDAPLEHIAAADEDCSPQIIFALTSRL